VIEGIVAVVVAYGAPELLDLCLGGLEQAVPVVVVDNSSNPNVRDVADRHGAAYVDPGTNLGFAGGVNIGIAQAEGRHVLLVNPDAVLTPAGIAGLVAALEADPRVAVVAPAQSGPDGPARVAWPFPTPSGAWLEAAGLSRLRQSSDFVIGSVLLIRAEAVADVGPFDDAFFLYAEETDWQRRATSRGWRTRLEPDVTASHVGAGTGGDPAARETHFQASHERYIRKHHGSVGWWSYRTAQLIGNSARAALRTGDDRRAAGLRMRLYWTGPLRAEAAFDGPGGQVAMTGDQPSRLRVVHVVVTDGFAGVERYICQVASGLKARGHDVSVIGGAPDRMTGELADGIPHRQATTVIEAARSLAETDADLVHVHMTSAEAASFLAGLRKRRPVVATRHFAAGRGTGWRNRMLARVTAAPIAHDIAISSYVAEMAGGPTVLIPNAVEDCPQASLRHPQVLMLQRLDVEKAPEVGIRAWAASGLGARGWRLVIAGNGILAPALRSLVHDLDCQDSVDFAGLVADTDGLLASTSILLAPAPAEPFGLAVTEAMAHGVAIVAAAGGGHLETVADAGVLFPPGDVEAAGQALVDLADDPDRLRSVGAALRQRQRDCFAMPLHIDRLEALYRDTLAGR